MSTLPLRRVDAFTISSARAEPASSGSPVHDRRGAAFNSCSTVSLAGGVLRMDRGTEGAAPIKGEERLKPLSSNMAKPFRRRASGWRDRV